MPLNENDMNIVILDGIAHQPIGKQIQNAFIKLSVKSFYVDLHELEIKRLYKLRRSCKKILNKLLSKKEYFYPEKLSEKSVNSVRELIKTKMPTIILAIGYTFPYFSKSFLQDLKKELSVELVLYDTEFGNFMKNSDKA